MPVSGEGPRRTTSLEEVVISTSLTNDGVVDPDTRRRGRHSTEPLLTGSSPQQQGHWFRHKARQSQTGSEYDPDEQAVPETSQETQQTTDEEEGLSASAIEKLSKLKVFQHLRERNKTQQHKEGVGDGAGAKHVHAMPARRPSVVHREANSLAGDLHTTEPTKKDAKEHHILKSFRRRLKRSSHGSKSQGSQEGMTDIVQMEELEEAERQAAKPAWKTKQFWRTAIPILVSVVLLVVGTVLGAKHYQRQNFNGNFEAWRWVMMIGVLVPINHTGNLMVKMLVWAVEYIFVFQKKALYYLVGTKKYLSRLIKGALVCGLFAAIFSGQSNNNPTVHKIYIIIIKVLVCIFLWLVVDVIKTMMAKLMANHFHQETYFQRMQEALRKEYFLMALSQPRSQANRASKHMRVGSVSPMNRAASVTAGMEPRNIEALRKAHEREQAEAGEKVDKATPPRGVLRTIKPLASSVASVTPRMVKFRSNIQYLGEKVAQVTPKPLKRMLSSRPSSRKATTEDTEDHHLPHRNALSSTSAEGAHPHPQGQPLEHVTAMKRAQTAPFPLSEHDQEAISISQDGMSLHVTPPQLGGSSAARATGEDKASPIGRSVEVNASNETVHHRRPGDSFRNTTDQGPVSRRTSASHESHVATPEPGASWQPSRASNSRRSLRKNESRREQPSGYEGRGNEQEEQPKRLSGWAKLRMARRMQGNVKAIQAEKQEKREEEIHLAELTATARNDEEVIAKLHKVEKHIRKNNLTVTFTDQLGQAKHSEHVTGEKEARKLAFYLFWNIKPYFTRNHIIMEDLEAFLSPEKAQEAFDMLDNNGDGKLVLADIRDAVIKIYKERRNLALSLKDTKTVVGKLELVIGVVLHIIFIFFYLMVFNVDLTKVWLTMSSIIVAFSFSFSNSIMNLFNSVILLFVVHPFDVGDALLIATNTTGTGAADYCVVEELSLVSTVMRRWDGTRIWYPNVKLGAMPLLNMSRSDAKVELFKVQVDLSTPSAMTATLRRNLMEFFDENHKEFVPGGGTVIYLDSQDPLKMTLGVVYTFSHNGVNLGRTGDARHKIFCFISSQLSHMDINYSLPSFQSSSAGNLPEGLAFARPNAVGPGATRTSFMRSTGFDTEAGGGGDGTHGTHADTGGMDI